MWTPGKAGYSDANQISNYAVFAMQWANAWELMAMLSVLRLQ